MNKGNLSRRGFLGRSLVALTAGSGVPLWYARQCIAALEEQTASAQKPAANSQIVMGAIGTGGQGTSIMNAARSQKGVVMVAVCDVDRGRRDKAAEKPGPDCAKYNDFRELLDRKDINAVTIGTPDHWHVLIALDAMRKGKDVYCEKPLTLTIAEGQALVQVARATGRVFQVGSQQRSSAGFRLACELVRNGRLGKIHTVETRIGGNPKGGPFPVVPVPPGLDWDFWQGPTRSVDYVKERCHYQFRWWYEYSGGKMTDWGAHHNDIAQWGLGIDGSGPVTVEAGGAAPSRLPNSYNCHPTFTVSYTYRNGTRLLCSNTQRPDAADPKDTRVVKGGKTQVVKHDNGVLFAGEKGQWIFVNRGLITASDPKLLQEPLPSDATRLYVSANHMANFIECVRSRKRPICDVEIGHRSVTVCHLGTIALRTGKKLQWDPVNEQFADAEANRWLRREMRPPWKLEA
jgi:predicted dehydrogenase